MTTVIGAPPAPTGLPAPPARPSSPHAPTSQPPLLGSRARRDSHVRLAAFVVLWASVLLVSYWWVAGGGVTDLGGWETGLTSAGRLTGLVASVLLMAQVLLMARIPVLERAFGQDRLARLHRLVGFTSFTLMLAHVGLITWGYAAGRLLATPGMLWDLTVDYPGMLLAVVGTACLIMVVVTSLRAARRRLRYESWHLLHLYAYLGVGLALPHQLWTGQEFLASTARTVFWWSWWIVAVGAIVVWRLALPLVATLRHRVRVIGVADEGQGTASVYLEATGTPVSAEAGQFLTLRFLCGAGWTRAHPYSLSAAPTGRHLRVTVKALGDGSAAVRGLRPGTRVLVEGPYGRLSARARSRRKVALIGAGVGVTPLRALAEGLDYAPGEAVLLYRFRSEPLFLEEFQALQSARGLRILWLSGHRRFAGSFLGSMPHGVSDDRAMRTWIPDLPERDVFVCGPPAWVAEVRRATDSLGLPTEQFHAESFEW